MLLGDFDTERRGGVLPRPPNSGNACGYRAGGAEPLPLQELNSGKSPLKGGFSVSYENLRSSVVILRDELPHGGQAHVLVLAVAHHQRGSLTDTQAGGLGAVLLRQQAGEGDVGVSK